MMKQKSNIFEKSFFLLRTSLLVKNVQTKNKVNDNFTKFHH